MRSTGKEKNSGLISNSFWRDGVAAFFFIDRGLEIVYYNNVMFAIAN